MTLPQLIYYMQYQSWLQCNVNRSAPYITATTTITILLLFSSPSQPKLFDPKLPHDMQTALWTNIMCCWTFSLHRKIEVLAISHIDKHWLWIWWHPSNRNPWYHKHKCISVVCCIKVLCDYHPQVKQFDATLLNRLFTVSMFYTGKNPVWMSLIL